VYDDRSHFKFLELEGAQAGLSWVTILKRRQGYKLTYAKFDPKKVAGFTDEDFDRLMHIPDIIRNKLKIQAAINNAKRFLEVQKEFGDFNTYIWQFVVINQSSIHGNVWRRFR